MGFLGRFRNLTRGLWLTRGSDGRVPGEDALDAELRTAAATAPLASTPTDDTPDPDPSTAPDTKGPERDDKGNVIKTL